ncbi:unnamed protein product [Calypogeia fissa]
MQTPPNPSFSPSILGVCCPFLMRPLVCKVGATMSHSKELLERHFSWFGSYHRFYLLPELGGGQAYAIHLVWWSRNSYTQS